MIRLLILTGVIARLWKRPVERPSLRASTAVRSDPFCAPALARYGEGDRPGAGSSNWIETIGEETGFGSASKPFLTLENGRAVTVSGKVDRIDRLTKTESLGVVDYKSGDIKFSFEKFFNGLNSQLPTYLAAIEELADYQEDEGTFGAMYLQMTDPIVALKDTKTLADAVNQSMKPLQYKGLFVADAVKELGPLYEKIRPTC